MTSEQIKIILSGISEQLKLIEEDTTFREIGDSEKCNTDMGAAVNDAVFAVDEMIEGVLSFEGSGTQNAI